jgi:NADH:ubiquinone oxidoreductase subunit E
MSKFPIPDKVVYVCTGSKCSKRGGKDMYKTLKSFCKHNAYQQDIEVIRVECTDRCDYAPVCTIQPDNIWLKEYHQKDVLKLLQQLTEQQHQQD